jgi:tetratricopeptide (TPR) repeat protein
MSQSPEPLIPPKTSADAESDEQPFVVALPDDPASGKDWYLWAGFLAILALVSFWPAVNGQFIWDDERHVSGNLGLRTFGGLVDIWTKKGTIPQYYPLTHTTYWLEYRFYQGPMGFHIVNLVLHALSAVVAWRLLRRLAVPGAWVAAAIWAVHPLQVETAAWISERKNILAGLFFFSSLFVWLEYAGMTGRDGDPESVGPRFLVGDRERAYWTSLGLFAAALLSKTVACSMPVVALLLMWWKGRKLTKDVTLTLIPFFVIGLALAGVTVYFETFSGGVVQAIGPEWKLSPVDRILIAGRGVWFYLAKLLVPMKLTFSYPRVTPEPWHWIYVLAAVAVGVIAWMGRKIWGRGPAVALAYYVVTLFPALGFISVYPFRYSFVADHFQYLSGLGIIVLIVASIGRLLGAGSDEAKEPVTKQTADSTTSASAQLQAPVPSSKISWPAIAATAGVLIGLAVVSHTQAEIYNSPEDLWRDTLAKNPSSWMAHDNLGIALSEDAAEDEANAFAADMGGHPEDAVAFRKEEKDLYAEALGHFEESLKLHPQHYIVHNSIGSAYLGAGDLVHAEQEFAQAVELERTDNPGRRSPAPLVNLALIYQETGRWDQAVDLLNQALALQGQPGVRDRDLAAAHEHMADYLKNQVATKATKEGRYADADLALTKAAEHYEAALRPLRDATRLSTIVHRARVHFDAGACYQALNQDALAMSHYESALKDSPSARHAGAYNGIGVLMLKHINEWPTSAERFEAVRRAMAAFQAALDIDPKNADARRNLENAQIMIAAATRASTQPTSRMSATQPAAVSTTQPATAPSAN